VAGLIKSHLASRRHAGPQALTCPPDARLGSGQGQAFQLCEDGLRHPLQIAALDGFAILLGKLRKYPRQAACQAIHGKELGLQGRDVIGQGDFIADATTMVDQGVPCNLEQSGSWVDDRAELVALGPGLEKYVMQQIFGFR